MYNKSSIMNLKSNIIINIILLIIIFVLLLLLLFFYRENKHFTNKIIKSNEIVEILNIKNKKLQININKLYKEKDSINILILKNLKQNDEKIYNIINLPDSIKVKYLSKRYNF